MIKIFLNILKKDDKKIEGIETWIVQWTKRIGKFSDDTRQCFQAFTNKDNAEKFAESIRTAHELIGNTSGNEVYIYKQK